ncbi:glycosyltransferase family 1 protein [Bacillus cereus]|uniref:glycosyltransferase family 4 protein n=1 Tax=Bacillus cereus TaxID=1396 RepID=UPI0009959B4C|nr:glycosyltransferase family 4 protein [Bacillus cereus]MBG9614829.1 hypothetical protein [Bacillus cereus]OPA19009.1 glycosyltransferase family 1 protein [Bacillus cereus]
MKKALIVTTVSPTITSFLIPSIDLLINKGYKVEVATNILDGSFRQKIPEEVVINHIPFSRNIKSLDNIKAYFKMKKLLKKNNYSLIHTHTPIASFLTRKASVKNENIIYTAHGFHFNENGSGVTNSIYKMIEKVSAKKTKRLVVINKDDYEEAKNLISINKVRHIKGVGVDMDEYNPEILTSNEKDKLKYELGIKPNMKVITHIAELNENKRQIDTILAAKKLRAIYGSEFVVLLVGRGPLSEYVLDQITQFGLENHVKCLGYRRDINNILSITDVGLLVSLREGLPKSVMEMMAMKVPVVLTNIRGNRDLVHNNKNGILVDIKSPEQIAIGCEKIMLDSDLAEKFRQESYKRMLEEYSLEKVMVDLEKLYDELV